MSVVHSLGYKSNNKRARKRLFNILGGYYCVCSIRKMAFGHHRGLDPLFLPLSFILSARIRLTPDWRLLEARFGLKMRSDRT